MRKGYKITEHPNDTIAESILLLFFSVIWQSSYQQFRGRHVQSVITEDGNHTILLSVVHF